MSSIEIPWPHNALWPNFRSKSHWPKVNATKKARQMAFWLTKAAKIGIVAGDVPIRLKITVHPRSSRRQSQPDKDAVTAALKATFDGMADAMCVNDRFFEPQPPVYADAIPGGKIVVEIL